MAEEIGEAGVNACEVGGVVDGGAVALRGELVAAPVAAQRHRGRVGFDEQAVGGDVLEGGALILALRIEVRAVEGKIGPELGERFDHLDGAGVGVKQKTRRGATRAEEGFIEIGPSVDAMDGGREALVGGELELPDKNLPLFVERGAAKTGKAGIIGQCAVEHPPIESDLPEARPRFGGEAGFEQPLPVVGPIAAIPRVHPVARHDPRKARSEGGDLWPIGGRRAIDDRPGDPDLGEIRRDAIHVRQQ